MDIAQHGPRQPRAPLLGAERDPDAARLPVGKFMEGEGRGETDDTARHELGGFGQGMMGINVGIG